MQKKIPFGRTIVTMSNNGRFCACHQKDEIFIYDLGKDNDVVFPVAVINWMYDSRIEPKLLFSPTGEYLVAAHYGSTYMEQHPDYDDHDDNLILVWDIASESIVYSERFTMHFKSPQDWLNSWARFVNIQFISAERFVTFSESGEVAVWSIKLKKRIYSIGASSWHGSSARVNHSGTQFAIIENNITNRRGRIGLNYVSGNHRTLGVGGVEKLYRGYSLRVWQLSDGQHIRDLQLPENIRDNKLPHVKSRLDFSHDDKYIAISTSEKLSKSKMLDTVHIIDLASGKIVQRLPENNILIGFMEDNQNLLVQEYEKSQISAWNILQERLYRTTAFAGEIYHTQMLTDNRVAVVTNEGKDSIAHVVDLGEMIVS